MIVASSLGTQTPRVETRDVGLLRSVVEMKVAAQTAATTAQGKAALQAVDQEKLPDELYLELDTLSLLDRVQPVQPARDLSALREYIIAQVRDEIHGQAKTEACRVRAKQLALQFLRRENLTQTEYMAFGTLDMLERVDVLAKFVSPVEAKLMDVMQPEQFALVQAHATAVRKDVRRVCSYKGSYADRKRQQKELGQDKHAWAKEERDRNLRAVRNNQMRPGVPQVTYVSRDARMIWAMSSLVLGPIGIAGWLTCKYINRVARKKLYPGWAEKKIILE